MAGMEEESNRKKFSNWMQSVQSLDITKKALHYHVLDVWTKGLMSLGKDIRDAIPNFIYCVANNQINHSTKKWTCVCEHSHCNTILEFLLNLQQNPGFSIVWNSNLCENITKGIELDSQDVSLRDYVVEIPNVETTSMSEVAHSLFNLSQYSTETSKGPDGGEKYKHIFDECKKEHIWCIANMFMQRGKYKTNISNTGPHDTDAAMFFRMMKNCKLFELENENHLYDDIIEARDRLHHSTTNRIPRATAKSYFDIMINILEKFEVHVLECKEALSRIKTMLGETILCISMPNMNIKELAKEALQLKQSALEVDKETEKAKGFSDADTGVLLEDAKTELSNAEDPENMFDGTKSKEDYKRENQEYRKKMSKLDEENKSLRCRGRPIIRPDDAGNNVKNPKKHFELITNLLQKSWHKPDIAAEIEARLTPVLDQIVCTASESDASFRKEAEKISEQTNSCERTDVQDKGNTKSGNMNIAAGGQADRNEDTYTSKTVKDPQKHFENMTSLVKAFANNPVIAEAISNNINPLLDEIVEVASKSDETLREKIEEVHRKEHSEQQTREYINQRQSQDQDSNTPDDEERNMDENDIDLNRGNADSLRLQPPSATTEIEQEPGTYRPHLWYVAGKQSHNIKAEQESNCECWGCCQLPTGEIILADFINRRLKKIDTRYQMMKVCDLAGLLWDVCYIGNNEVVVSSFSNVLQFVDVVSMTLTRSVKTVHECCGMTCHGTKLYVSAPDSVYVYRTDGTEQRVLYTLPEDTSISPWHYSIAVNDEGSKIYITTSGHLFTIDNSGNHLFTLVDQDLDDVSGVCVDCEGYVLVCNVHTGSILQVSHDGKHKIGLIMNKSDGIKNPKTIFFDRHKSTVTCAGRSNDITVLQLK